MILTINHEWIQDVQEDPHSIDSPSWICKMYQHPHATHIWYYARDDSVQQHRSGCYPWRRQKEISRRQHVVGWIFVGHVGITWRQTHGIRGSSPCVQIEPLCRYLPVTFTTWTAAKLEDESYAAITYILMTQVKVQWPIDIKVIRDLIALCLSRPSTDMTVTGNIMKGL